MIKRFLQAAVMLCASLAAAQNVQPIVQPHAYFLDASGNPCAGCSLFTYSAGTTTPLATYTDSTGGTPNTNPIVLGADGGPPTNTAIWLTSGVAYKFVLQSASSATIWTVDNVVGGLYLSNTFCPLTGCTFTGTIFGTNAAFGGAVTSGTGFNGPGTGLTGVAAGLGIGGNAVTAGTATHALNLPADFATQSAAAAAAGTFTTETAADNEGPVGTTTPAPGKFTTIAATQNFALAMPTGNISANTCTTPTVQAFTGISLTPRFTIGYATSPVGATGWGTTGGLVIALWVDSTPATGFDWAVCNQTTSTINAGAITINVGVM